MNKQEYARHKIASKLRPKHKLLARNLIKHDGNQSAAYLATYPNASVTSASALASRTIKEHPAILEYARAVMDSQGVTIERLAKKIDEKLEATKTIVVDNDTMQVSDNTSQLKAVELGLKVHGIMYEQDNSININIQENQQQIINLFGERLNQLSKMFEKFETKTSDEINAEFVIDNAAEEIQDNNPDESGTQSESKDVNANSHNDTNTTQSGSTNIKIVSPNNETSSNAIAPQSEAINVSNDTNSVSFTEKNPKKNSGVPVGGVGKG